MTSTAVARDSFARIAKKGTRASHKPWKTSQGDQSHSGLPKDLEDCQSLGSHTGGTQRMRNGVFSPKFWIRIACE